MSGGSGWRVPACLAAAPGLLLVGGLLLLVAIEAFGGRPLTRGEPATLPEAVIANDASAVMRLVRRGLDPNRPAVVRAGWLGPADGVMTPAEAARLSGHPGMLALLRRVGLLSPGPSSSGQMP